MLELHMSQSNAHVLPKSLPLHKGNRSGLYGGKKAGSVLSGHHMSRRWASTNYKYLPKLLFSSFTVPVQLLTSTTTESSKSTDVGHPDTYGCSIDNLFYSDGARVPSDPNKPCELCYCIRNRTACVMQECTLKIEGCKPVYQEGVCCPVKYDCGKF